MGINIRRTPFQITYWLACFAMVYIIIGLAYGCSGQKPHVNWYLVRRAALATGEAVLVTDSAIIDHLFSIADAAIDSSLTPQFQLDTLVVVDSSNYYVAFSTPNLSVNELLKMRPYRAGIVVIDRWSCEVVAVQY